MNVVTPKGAPATKEFVALKLKYMNPESLVKTLTELQIAQSDSTRFVADVASNALLVYTSDAATLKLIKSIIEKMDVEAK